MFKKRRHKDRDEVSIKDTNVLQDDDNIHEDTVISESIVDSKRKKVTPKEVLVEKVNDNPNQVSLNNIIDSNKQTTEDTTSRTEIDSIPISKSAYGPRAAPSNLRTTVRFDFQPDICKDYKETGYCGYGDNCKFMHDRGDYLTGWELEKQYENNKEQAKVDNNKVEQESKNTEEDKPFACHLCRKPFTPPVVITLCKHYFCQSCAIERFKKNAKCGVCGEQTKGVFNLVEAPS